MQFIKSLLKFIISFTIATGMIGLMLYVMGLIASKI